ncbi:hypothetical protein ACEUAT_20970 [Aeromonas veronii]
MSQEVISDFLIKFGFDARNVEKGLKNLTRLTENYENKLKKMAIAPKIVEIEQKFKQVKQPAQKVNPKENKKVLTAEQKIQRQITAFTKKQLNTAYSGEVEQPFRPT